MNIIHGDMKGVSRLNNMLISPQALILSCSLQDNVLVSDDGQPRLCDFGISRIISASETLKGTTTSGVQGSLRWMAPDFFRKENPVHSKEIDVWGFGATVYVSLFLSLSIMPLLTYRSLPAITDGKSTLRALKD